MSEIPHGAGGYTNHGCRCDICRSAHSRSCEARRHRRFTMDLMAVGFVLACVIALLGVVAWCVRLLWHFRGIPNNTPMPEAARIARARRERARRGDDRCTP